MSAPCAFDFAWRRGDFELLAAHEMQGTSLGVFGPSGSGKTTLLRLLAGLEFPDKGWLQVNGEMYADAERRLPPEKRRVGLVFQEGLLFPHLDVRANLRYGMRAARPTPRFQFDEVIRLLELEPLLARRTRSLSGGERQRVALGRALLRDPDLLLLDEPLAALDVRLKRQILTYLQRLAARRELPLIYVSHDMDELRQVTEQLLLVDRGQTLLSGSHEALCEDPAAWPLLHEAGIRNLWRMQVVGHDAREGLTRLRSASGLEIAAAWSDLPLGTEVTAALAADDIALAPAPVPGISMQNQLTARVKRVETRDQGRLCFLDAGETVLAEVTAKGAQSLELKVGQEVTLLFKASAARVWR